MNGKLAAVFLGFIGFVMATSAQSIESVWGFTNGFYSPRNPIAPLTRERESNEVLSCVHSIAVRETKDFRNG